MEENWKTTVRNYYIEFGNGHTEYRDGNQKDINDYCMKNSKAFTMYDTAQYPEMKGLKVYNKN